MNESKISVEAACEMSLDDYIKASPSLAVPSHNISRKYRNQRRSENRTPSKAPPKQFNKNNCSSNQRHRNRGAPINGINRNNQTIANRRSYNAWQSDVTNGIPTNQPQALALISSLYNPNDYMNMANALIEKLTEKKPQGLNEPKYDMDVQKAISEIQGKSSYYADTKGVISSDGPGVDDCRFNVNSTSMTLNRRFS